MCSYIVHHHTSTTHNSLHDDLWHKIMHHYVFILARHVVTDKEESWKELKKKEKKKGVPKLSHTHHATHTHYVSSESVWEMRIILGPIVKKVYLFSRFVSVSVTVKSLSVLTTTQNFTLMVPLCLVSNTKRIFFLSHLSMLQYKTLYHALSKNCSM